MKRVLLLFIFSLFVYAHRVDVYAEYYNGKIDVFGYFSDGTPTKNADVKIFSPDGKLLFEGKTDKSGRIEINPPKGVNQIKIVLYAGLGHKAETTLILKNPEVQSSQSRSEVVKNGTSKTENPPKPRLKESFTWRDIFCGFGWILGLFGILGFFKCRRKWENGKGEREKI